MTILDQHGKPFKRGKKSNVARYHRIEETYGERVLAVTERDPGGVTYTVVVDGKEVWRERLQYREHTSHRDYVAAARHQDRIATAQEAKCNSTFKAP